MMNTASPNTSSGSATWTKLLVMSLTILVWAALTLLFLWLIGKVISAVLSFVIAILIAYAVYPLVKRFQQVMPRTLAILLVYVIVFLLLMAFLYILLVSAVSQISSMIVGLQAKLTAPGGDLFATLSGLLQKAGLSETQLKDSLLHVITLLQGLANDLLAVLGNLFSIAVSFILVLAISIFACLSGSRALTWLRTQTPLAIQGGICFLLDTLEQVVGGYIRGQLLLSLIVATITAVTMWLIGVPFAIFIFIITFVFEFIPVIGVVLTGVICILLGLSHSLLTAGLALVAVIVIEVLEGDFLSPRILGKSLGLNPLVTLVAMLAFSELFGLWGALFAAPLSGFLQVLLVTGWRSWRSSHPEQFGRKADAAKATS